MSGTRTELALSLPVDVPADLARPLEVAMVIKGLDTEGEISYWCVSTGGLTGVEIGGMMLWGMDVSRRAGKEDEE